MIFLTQSSIDFSVSISQETMPASFGVKGQMSGDDDEEDDVVVFENDSFSLSISSNEVKRVVP